MLLIRICFLSFLLLVPTAIGAWADSASQLRVITSIKPVHSLVAAVMAGTGQPDLILDGTSSPHGYTLKPSKAGLLAKADIIFWVGPTLEAFLQKSINTIGVSAVSVELEMLDGLKKLLNRDFEDFESSSHSANHDHGTTDPHIWLDPDNAKIMTQNIAATLARVDPDNAAIYNTNADILVTQLENLAKEIDAKLITVKGQPFLTHHDAYQYFEASFGLTSKGALISNSEIVPGARHIAQIAKKLKELGSICLFTEPQLSQKLVNTLAQGTNIKIAQLDPLGINIKNSPDLYFELIRTMATSFHDCLSEPK